MLIGREDFVDYNGSINDITTIPRGYITRFDSTISIPTSFDMVQLIGQFKPMILDSVSSTMDRSEEEAFRSFFETKNPKIPICMEIDNELIISKIEFSYLLIEYNQLEEYDNIDCTVLARFTSNQKISREKPFYDPLKDFFALNRETRKNFAKSRPSELREIFCDDDYINVEVLAIYQ